MLAVKNNIALLLADRILDIMLYDEAGSSIWADCSLRRWLNNEFMQTAFTPEEQEAIKVTTLGNFDNPKYGTPGGPATQDKVFLLSYEDLVNLEYGFSNYPGGQRFHNAHRAFSFTEQFARERQMTAYAYLKQAYDDIAYLKQAHNDMYVTPPQELEFFWWLLRSPGGKGNYAVFVNDNGCINQYGQRTTIAGGICPALRLDLASGLWNDAGKLVI